MALVQPSLCCTLHLSRSLFRGYAPGPPVLNVENKRVVVMFTITNIVYQSGHGSLLQNEMEDSFNYSEK